MELKTRPDIIGRIVTLNGMYRPEDEEEYHYFNGYSRIRKILKNQYVLDNGMTYKKDAVIVKDKSFRIPGSF